MPPWPVARYHVDPSVCAAKPVCCMCFAGTLHAKGVVDEQNSLNGRLQLFLRTDATVQNKVIVPVERHHRLHVEEILSFVGLSG